MVKKFSVGGMTCSACSMGIEKGLKKLDGVNDAVVSLLLKELSVDFNEDIISQAKIIETVEKLGYSIGELGELEKDKFGEAKKLRNRFLISLIFLLPLLYFSMGVMMGIPAFENKINFLIQFIFASIIIAVNFKFYINGIKAVIHKSPNMDTLVSLGSISAYVYSVTVTVLAFLGWKISHTFFEASAMVLALVTLGKWLEEISKVKTGDAIEKLNKLIPKTATIIKDGKMITVLTNQIEAGDTVVLRVGDYVAIDGVVVEGTASVDKSAITGESLPEEVKVDDFISSGSIIKDGFLLVEAIQVGGDTLFSKIIEIVKSSGASKAPIQRLADKISGVFVPVVTLLALAVFGVWFIVTGELYTALSFGISVLVISCPCALGLATPVAVMASTGAGASKGILFKDAGAMQNASKINCVLLDKTATITVGKPKVTDFVNYADLSDKEIYSLVSALESKSRHPLADCVCEFCGNSDKIVQAFEYIVGKGVVGSVDGVKYSVGSNKILSDSLKENAVELEKKYFGKTVLYFSDDESILAVFAVADYLKEDSALAVNVLKERGIKTVMLTGDSFSVAKSIAEQVGIEEFEAEILPQQKYEIVNKYKEKGYFVAMVGDGINDSPALKSADLGIAMGTGTDIAIDSSDIIIANGSLNGVNQAVDLSKKSNRIIKQNLFWAFIYNLIAMPVAGGAFAFIGFTLTPALASVCMSLSSLFVVGNALRITRKNRTSKVKKVKLEQKYSYEIVIDGMSCGHCSEKVEKALAKLNGVINVTVDLKSKIASVATEKMIDDELLISLISNIGYKVLSIKIG